MATAILSAMRVAIADIREKMAELLRAKGYAEDDILFLIEMYLGGELRGHTSHGLASFPGFIKEDFSKLPEPEIVKETAAFFLLDAKGNSGNIVGKRAADEAIKRAKKEVVGSAMIKNMDSWLRPGAIAQYVADQGLLAVVVNSGGGASIAPPGGYDSVLGTNPIAYGIPTEDGPLVVDMATAKHAWGQVRLANKYGTDLPVDSFYDNEGNVTLDPKKAWSVKPAGEYKGFSLALLIEIICGSLVGMPMMIDSHNAGSTYGTKLLERGGLIYVIDPEQMTGLKEFKSANSDLVSRIKATHSRKGEQVRIPGTDGSAMGDKRLKDGYVEVADEVWNEIMNLFVGGGK
jgi:L-2-hydroxycarboxylate dehydrogenase (NAD+)